MNYVLIVAMRDFTIIKVKDHVITTGIVGINPIACVLNL